MKKLILTIFLLLGMVACADVPNTSVTYNPSVTPFPTATYTATITPNYQATTIQQTATSAVTTRQYVDSFVTADIATFNAELRQISHEATLTQIHQLSVREKEKTFYAPYFRVMWLVGLFGIILSILIWLLVQSMGIYQQNQPVVYYDDNGGKFVIPSNQVSNLSAAFVRAVKSTKPNQVSVTEETNNQIIDLPEIKEGHVLLAGETGSGKTTAMMAVLLPRQNVTILDPHDSGSTWGNSRVIGAGRNFEAISNYLMVMQKELETRFSQRANGRENFVPLTVATDELPSIISAIGKDFGIVWRAWIREGRKVGLFVVMATQSTRVQTMGIKGEGDLLENFNYIITLGKVAQTVYKDLVEGMERPAVIHSVDGIFPVRIPYIQNHVVESGIDPNNLLDSDKQRIIESYKKHGVMRKVQLEVFGYEGGNAYTIVKQILDEAGLL